MPSSLTIAAHCTEIGRAQAESVARDLSREWPDAELNLELASGATYRERVDRVRRLVRAGRADFAVHGYDELPRKGKTRDRLTVPSVPQRADPRDVLISRNDKVFTYLPQGARIGVTGAWREAQILRRRSDLRIVQIEGDLDARLRRLGEGELDALVVSAAVLYWLGRLDLVSEYIDTDILIPAPGQGVLALEARPDDDTTLELLAPLHAELTSFAVRAERACRAHLGGPDDAPVGVFATTDGESIFIHGVVARLDGRRAARLRWTGPYREPDDVGITLAEALLAIGARQILSGEPMPPTTRYDLPRMREGGNGEDPGA